MVLTTTARDSQLDLDPWIGQRSASYRYALVNGVTGQPLGPITPLRSGSLSHDTGRTIMRQLSIPLGAADVARINTLTDRLDLSMVFGNGDEYPLGRYMFTDDTRIKFTSGRLGSPQLTDEMFIVDQEIEAGYSANGKNCTSALQEVFAGFSFDLTLEASPYSSVSSWGVGTMRGQIIQSLALEGDYFNPWFGNDRTIHAIRAFDPASVVPRFDFDSGKKVLREGITEQDDILAAPNRFIVISNAGTDPLNPVVGRADVPITAPHSIPNRGFVQSKTVDLQIGSPAQAQAVAENLALRNTVFERVQLQTAADPRHDSWDVVRWVGEQWLEIGWSIDLSPGGLQTHILRKAYS